MILRVRFPSGATQRVTLPEGADLPALGAAVDAMGRMDGQFSLYADVKLTTPFDMSGAQNGDFVYVNGKMKETDASKPSGAASVSAGTAGAAATAAGAASSANGSGAGAGAVAGGGKGLGTAGRGAEKAQGRGRCLHGPRGMCENCMPREDKRDRYKAELAKWKGKGMSVSVMEALEALKFKIVSQDESHASAALVDNAAANEFQSYLAATGFSQQRIGICYGEVDEETSETKVHAIYEPPQRGNEEAYALVEGEEAGDMSERADALAGMLGIKKAGIVFSAKPRKSILSARDIIVAAKTIASLNEQDRKAFVILVVTIAETGETLFEAYQISDLAVELYEAGIFEPEEKQKPNGGRVLCTEDVLVEGKDTKKVHTEFFLLNIPIKSFGSWLHTSFATENRDIAPQGPADLKKLITTRTSDPYSKRLADFHALLFLSNVFDMNTDMPGLVAAVKDQSADIGEGYRLMIEGIASS